jgi:uncharacterized protein
MSKSPIVQRQMASVLTTALKQYPIISITGPRQSGKTTIAHLVASGYVYLNMEIDEHKNFAEKDPNGFLKKYDYKIILDEVQAVPNLFVYLQQHTDKQNKNGAYILSGSQNFLLMEKISQTLAGRIAIFSLLPFSLVEIFPYLKQQQKQWANICLRGFYPRLFMQKKMNTHIFYNSYCKTYVERDIRQLLNVHNSRAFMQFLKLSAIRVASNLNAQEIATAIGVDNKTIAKWISVLEASYIIHLLPPYYNNFDKRIIKKPKIYFYDTGLLCHLLNIKTEDELKQHKFAGGIFENFVINEKLKLYYNKGLSPNFYFWQDSNGKEVDLIIESNNKLQFIEIKSSSTPKNEFYKNLTMLELLAKKQKIKTEKTVIYGGDDSYKIAGINLVSWQQLAAP